MAENHTTQQSDGDFQRWLTQRFDRIDEKIDQRIGSLEREMKDTRHAQRGSLETIAAQVVRLVEQMNAQQRELAAIEEWRGEGGQLDLRLRRHSSRIDTTDAWRNRITGAVGALMFLFPTTVGVILWVLGQ